MEPSNQEKIVIINNNDILPNRFQPRKKFSEDELLDLTESIKKYGILEPIIVRTLGDKYELIAGERRYKANVLAGNETIPAIVKNLNDAECSEIAIIENLQRKDLSPLEEALSYKRYIDLGYATQQQLAEKVGKSQSYIANKIRLLKLSDEVQEALMENKISERHARSLLRINSLQEQNEMLNKIIKERLTVRKTDEEIDKMNNNIYNNENTNNGAQLQTTPLSSIFNENQENNQPINENGVFTFGPDTPVDNNQGPALMSFDVNGNPVNNQTIPNMNPIVDTEDNDDSTSSQATLKPQPFNMFGGENAPEPQMPSMPTMAPQNPQPEVFGMFNNTVNTPEPQTPNMPQFEPQPSVQPEPFSMFNNGVNATEQQAPSMPTMAPQASAQPEPFGMFNNGVNVTEQQTPNVPPFEPQASAQPEPFSMFNNGVNVTEQQTPNVPPFEPQPSIQPEPFGMFNNGVNATEPQAPNIPPYEPQPSIQPQPFNIPNNEFDTSINQNTQLNDVQPTPFISNDIPKIDESSLNEPQVPSFDLNNGQNVNNQPDGFNLNNSSIPSTPIFENNQPSDTIAEFKKPDPIIVTDYNKQYDPVMPEEKPKAPDIDLKTIINLIRQCSDTIEKCGYKIDTEEYDLENMYQVVFKIDKM